MKIIKLNSHLINSLQSATEVYIASAIVSDSGLDFLLDNIPGDCNVRLIIGIDLPTPDSVFRRLLEIKNDRIKAKVFTKSGFFHPKLYLVKGNTNVVFIGSGNFTEGGLGRNIELFHKIGDNNLYQDYEIWFNQYYNLADIITEEWVIEYSKLYGERNDIEATDKRKVGDFKRRLSGNKPIVNLSTINFSNQFFKLIHYLAFEGDKPNQRTSNANNERYEVKEKLMELHDMIFPVIQKKGWDLHPHSMEQHIVSSYQHGEHTAESLDALWLHYGRSQFELDRFKEIYGENQTSLYHMRIQVVVHLNDIAVWLRVGKNNGSVVDREAFKREMKIQSYRDRFFSLLSSLPNEFSIAIAGEWRGVKSFSNSADLYDFVRNDDIRNHYFIIGRQYAPDAIEISEDKIANTVINDFEKLLPLYNLIKTKI